MKVLTKIAVVCLLGLIPIFSHGQSGSVATFGKVSPTEVKMVTYEPDTSAHAVILFDKGRLNGTTGLFTRHLRLKILTTAGLSYANFQVRTPTKSSIDGFTYNYENGKVVETALAKENIYKEEIVTGFTMYKIFFSNVKPGSIIELKYSFNGVPYEWRFQDKIPVVHSELILERSGYITFKKTLFGGQYLTTIDDTHWVARNVPAFQEEPLMSHYTNYLTHFKIDILSLSFYGRAMDFSTDWETIGRRLWEAESFGGIIWMSPFLNDKARDIKKSEEPLAKKIQSAFSYVQENIKWNGSKELFAADDYKLRFEKNHTGNSADVNLILISLLKKAGIKVYPAVMSTRDNGLLNPASGSLTSLDYVVAYIQDGDIEMFVDATDPNILPGVLPVRCRNTSAYVINSPTGWWVDTSKGKSHSKKQYINITLGADGTTATVTNTFEGYGFLDWIEAYDKHGSEEAYGQSVIAKSSDIEVSSCKVSIDRSKLKAIENINVVLSGSEHFQDLGSEVVINPFIFNDIVNPFKNEVRKYPVDFMYPVNRSIIVALKIPDGYTLRKVPDALQMRPQNGGARFSFESSSANSIFTMKCNLVIENQIFSEEDYASLRNFFVEINRKFSEAIQLDKKT